MAFPRPDHLLTIDEYAALGETEIGYTELLEGRLLMSPSPVPKHNNASFALAVQLTPQVPDDYTVIQDIDVDLQLAPSNQAGSSRRPDLLVAECAASDRADDGGGIIRASEVLLVVEIVSPGSRRTDNVHKRHDYADAGIPHYWIIDIEPPISLVSCFLTKEFGYVDSQAVTGGFTATEPFPVKVDLDRLRRKRRA